METEPQRSSPQSTCLAAEVTGQGNEEQTQHGVAPNLSPEDLDILQRLQDAGVISLDALKGSSQSALTTWTLSAYEAYVASRDTSSATTAAKYRRRLRRLAEHDHAPVELRPPCEDSWLENVAWRRRQGQSNETLNSFRSALIVLFEFLERETGVQIRWPSLKRSFKTSPATWRLPDDETVTKFWHYPYPGKAPRRALAQYMFRFGFLTGVRAPSELAVLDVQDIDLDARAMYVTQPKKNGKVNVREDEPVHVLTAQNEKSVKNWLDVWRPRLDPNTDALFPYWRTGERWDKRTLQKWLRANGKRVWEDFSPYTMRRWYATTLLVETDLNVFAVADRLDDTVATVERHYLDRARARAGIKERWQVPRLRQGGSP